MILALVVWVAVMLALGLVYTSFSRHPLDPVALFCYLIVFFYVFRETAITFHVDGPYPDELFLSGQTNRLLVKGGLALVCFLVPFAGAYMIHEPYASNLRKFTPVAWTVPTVPRQARLAIGLTAVSTVISMFLVARYGGIAGVIKAGKRTHTLAGSYELRIPPAMGAVVAASLVLALWQERRQTGLRRPLLEVLAPIAALLDGAYVLLWGSRQAAAVVLFILLAGRFLLGQEGDQGGQEAAGHPGSRPKIARFAMIGLVIVLAIVGLRVVRDNLVSGHVQNTIQGQSAIRSVSVATNSTYFDAVLLATRDWPSTFPYRHGEDFKIGLQAVVPRALWPGKPQDVRTGSWFRQVYEPKHFNGWPLGAVGDWYLNFGFIGLVIAGVISGLIYSGLAAAWRLAPWSPFTLAALMCTVIFVVPTGLEALSLLRWAQWTLPLLLCARYLDRPARMAAGSRHALREATADLTPTV